MTLAEFSIRRNVFAWMLMASMILFGWFSYKDLGVSQLPDVDFPIVNVSVTMDGASPEVMESDVVDIIESGMMGLQGLKDISSVARYGSASITLEFEINQDIDEAIQEVNSRISQQARRLPADSDAPVVSKNNPEDQPILWVGLSGQMPSSRDLMLYAKEKVVPQFQLVPGVGDVFLGGYLDPNIRIWVDKQKLAAYELTTEDVISALNREHIEFPAGTLQRGAAEFSLRVLGEASSPKDIANLIISRRGGAVNFRTVRIGDVARVEAGTEDVRRMSRILGEPAVGIGIRKQRGTNSVEVAKAVKAKMVKVQETLPANLKLGVNFDNTKFVEESTHELQFELLLAAFLTGLICYFFLGSWSSTFNILMALPTSLVGAFMIFKLFGFTLNSFTLLALILAVGIVVDDAILILENIVRHKQMGKSNFKASKDGANEVTFAAIATTLAIVAIFLPVAFMDGVIGKFFFQFGIVLSFAVLLSLVEALTLTPMRCSRFISAHENTSWMHKGMLGLEKVYESGLRVCLNHRWKVVVTSLAIFVGSFWFAKDLRREFVPTQDQGIFMIRLQTPIGSSIEYTSDLIKQVEERLSKTPEILRYFVSIGGMGGGGVNTAMAFVTLKDIKERSRSQQQVMDSSRKALAEIKDLKVVIQDLSSGGFGGGRGFPIEFSLRGPEWQKLVELSEELQNKMKTDKRFVDVDSNYDSGRPEIKIIPDRQKAALIGVSIEDIGKSISTAIGGTRVGRFTEDGRRIDVRLRLEEEDRIQPEDILNLKVRNNRGELVRIGDMATLKSDKALVSITRQQRERAISVYANVAPGESQAKLLDVVAKLGKELPAGYRLVPSGSSAGFAESFRGLTFALWLGVIVAYMILAAQFNSFIHPFTVLLSLPFSLTGAWFGLWLGNASLNMYSMIGLILLMGIVKKNAIMLVDFANQRRQQGLNPNQAMIESGPLRLRPILMTSITMISASLPSVLALGPGSETRAPMSLAVIGGVTVSTFFTLFVIPVAYSLFSQLERKPRSDEV